VYLAMTTALSNQVSPSLFEAFRWWSASENYGERKSGKNEGRLGKRPFFFPALSLAIFFARAPLSERLEQAKFHLTVATVSPEFTMEALVFNFCKLSTKFIVFSPDLCY